MVENNGTPTLTTAENTPYKLTGNRAIFPTTHHKDGGGVALTHEAVNAIMGSPDGGELEAGQLEWNHDGETAETRVGESKLVEITQTSFGRERTVTVTLVDIADVDLEIARSEGSA